MTKRNPHSTQDMVSRAFWLPVEHAEALRRLAERNQRTMSGELRLIVANHLAANTDEQMEKAA